MLDAYIINGTLLIIIVCQMGYYIWILNHSRNMLKLQVYDLENKLNYPISKLSNEKNDLITSSICQKFKQQSKSENVSINVDDWKVLENTVLKYFKDFDKKVGKSTLLNINEYKVSLLLKCNFKPCEISKLVFLSKENVSSIRRRLCQKYIDSRDVSPKKWDEFIQNI